LWLVQQTEPERVSWKVRVKESCLALVRGLVLYLARVLVKESCLALVQELEGQEEVLLIVCLRLRR
jgi:hypothetical protein